MSDSPSLTRRALIAAAGLAAALAAAPLHAQGAREVVEMALGDPEAPVTMVEYASFTCPHCADFALNVMPELKAQYIDTGKVRLIYREVYFDRPSLWASMIARCAGEDRYFGVAELLFRDQQTWTQAADAQGLVNALFSIGRQAGMIDGEMQACMQDGDFAQALVTWFQGNAQTDSIDATPTFVLNGEKLANMPWPELKAKIEEKLGS
ncbi:DsbA family protein [Amaricoccus sp.]|uniref:DsbA family protein n=1 Tax=Amaricoccus sp. TaxID=1872485 RepID=UPI001B676D0D|nr:DsbA family protein [Amaricoccus sp.]MBP7240497.1 DsbA family protein [Amaricoccus sp.]